MNDMLATIVGVALSGLSAIVGWLFTILLKTKSLSEQNETRIDNIMIQIQEQAKLPERMARVETNLVNIRDQLTRIENLLTDTKAH